MLPERHALSRFVYFYIILPRSIVWRIPASPIAKLENPKPKMDRLEEGTSERRDLNRRLLPDIDPRPDSPELGPAYAYGGRYFFLSSTSPRRISSMIFWRASTTSSLPTRLRLNARFRRKGEFFGA